ncbi:MAG: 2,3-bisphosphoglycerate-independent phosphoglycerate mutase [Nanoarchaeota archaeon]|nr:2,3-bisphosphoglycerate-independent phosphoglycerate mutase [Nanoarchaeota archaeon]MCG2719352.1 alkaline phosphatase family protein [Nanoarchaeota archaeon]
MRTIFVILDGAADLPNKELKNKTPFEAAKTPNLDYFAKEGACGLMYTVGKDIAPESDVAVTALLGYDPEKYFTGRGPLEAYGAGFKLKRKFLALRTNFATIENNSIVDRRVGRSLTTKEAKDLARTINKEVKLPCKFKFKSTTEHRGVLVLYGDFSANISNVDPAYEKKGTFGVAKANKEFTIQECKPLDNKAKKTAEIINEFVRQSRALLELHPINKQRKNKNLAMANVILPRDAGNKLPSFPKKKNWAAVVGMPLEIGITKLVGMDVLKFRYPRITSSDAYKHLYKSLDKEIEASVKALNKTDKNLYIHFKETDIPGHDGLPKEKKKMIEIIDKKFFSKVRKLEHIKLIVTCDHNTPCELKAHSADPVPLLVYDGIHKDEVETFSEKACKKGSLKIQLGKDLMLGLE